MRELTLFNFNNTKYGIWRDEFQALKDVTAIHWLPPHPGYIAGMASMDKRTVTLFDLSACLGLSALSRSQPSYPVLLLDHEEKHGGFLVDFVIGDYNIPAKSILPMPDYLKTPVIDTCVALTPDSTRLIPVINIAMLFENALHSGFEPPRADFDVPRIQEMDSSGIKTVNVIKIGDASFAVPASNGDKMPVKPGSVSKIDLMPSFIEGVTVQTGRVIPLIHLAKRMKMPEEGPSELMLVLDIGGQDFGLLVDSSGGQLQLENLIVMPMPPLAKSDWLLSAIINSGEIIPMINPGMLLADRSGGLKKIPLPQRYHPDSNFNAIFSQSEVKVLEFSLFDVPYAVPKSEVEDSLRLIPYKQLPGVNPIVAGVAKYDGELLPVLDLAKCFGRQSLVTQQWQMILIKNGDFRALVLAESILGERLLPVNMQHRLPFGDSLSLVYGCYPDESVVRLILNIEAMAVNFDKTNFKKYFGSFANDEKKNPAKIKPDVPEPEVIDEIMPEEPLVPDVPEEEAEAAISEDIEKKSELDAIVKEDDIFDEELEIDPQIGVQAADDENPDENLFDKLSDAFDSSIDSSMDQVPAADRISTPIGDVEDSAETDKELFEKLNEAFDSTMNQPVEPEPEELQDVIEEIFFNEVKQGVNEESLVQLEQEMEIVESGMEIIPGESEYDAAYIEPDEFADLMEEDVEEQIEPIDDFENIGSEEIPDAETASEEALDEMELDADAEDFMEPDEADIALEFSEESMPEEPEASEEPSGTDELPDEEPEEPEASEEPSGTDELPDEEPEEPEELMVSALHEETVEDREDKTEPEDIVPEKSIPDYYNLKTHVDKKPKNKFVYVVIAILLLFGVLFLLYLFGGSENSSDSIVKEKAPSPAMVEKYKVYPVKPATPLAQKNRPALQPASGTVEVNIKKNFVPDSSENNNPAPAKSSKPVAQKQPPEISYASEPVQKEPETENLTALERVVPEEHKTALPGPLNQPESRNHPSITSDSSHFITYTVKKGDTLWSISKRRTGSGFNYPEVAKNNKINNPDLIFPEEKIVFKKIILEK